MARWRSKYWNARIIPPPSLATPSSVRRSLRGSPVSIQDERGNLFPRTGPLPDYCVISTGDGLEEVYLGQSFDNKILYYRMDEDGRSLTPDDIESLLERRVADTDYRNKRVRTFHYDGLSLSLSRYKQEYDLPEDELKSEIKAFVEYMLNGDILSKGNRNLLKYLSGWLRCAIFKKQNHYIPTAVEKITAGLNSHEEAPQEWESKKLVKWGDYEKLREMLGDAPRKIARLELRVSDLSNKSIDRGLEIEALKAENEKLQRTLAKAKDMISDQKATIKDLRRSLDEMPILTLPPKKEEPMGPTRPDGLVSEEPQEPEEPIELQELEGPIETTHGLVSEEPKESQEPQEPEEPEEPEEPLELMEPEDLL